MVNFVSFAPNELPANSTMMVVKKINFNASIAERQSVILTFECY